MELLDFFKDEDGEHLELHELLPEIRNAKWEFDTLYDKNVSYFSKLGNEMIFLDFTWDAKKDFCIESGEKYSVDVLYQYAEYGEIVIGYKGIDFVLREITVTGDSK